MGCLRQAKHDGVASKWLRCLGSVGVLLVENIAVILVGAESSRQDDGFQKGGLGGPGQQGTGFASLHSEQGLECGGKRCHVSEVHPIGKSSP